MMFGVVGQAKASIADLSTTVGTNGELYCIVDLSAGWSATNYPVSFRSSIPQGGWSDEYKTTKLVLRRISAGEFMLANVTNALLTKSYYIGVFEVTQKQWELVIGDWKRNFSHFVRYAGDKRPADACSYRVIRGGKEGLSWPCSDAVDEDSFLYRLRKKTGLRFDLPTEAQWEYAARANATNGMYYAQQNSEDSVWAIYKYLHIPQYAEHAPVGSLAPNKWGLYDMCGNVWEWCLDAPFVVTSGHYATDGRVISEPDIRDVLVFGGVDPKGADTDLFNNRIRMMRGGGWNSSWLSCYSGARRTLSFNLCQDATHSEWDCGFRLVVGCDYGCTVSVEVIGSGSVVGCGKYDYGATADLNATPAAGYCFSGWNIAGAEYDSSASIPVCSNMNICAVFTPKIPSVTATTTLFDRILISWEKLAWAERYKIYSSCDGVRPPAPVAIVDGDCAEYADLLANPGAECNYWVEAVGDSENSVSPSVQGRRLRLEMVELSIRGKSESVFTGESVEYECWVLRNDSSCERVLAEWTIGEGGDYASVDAEGRVTGLDVGTGSEDVVLVARYAEDGMTKTVQRQIRIVSPEEKYKTWEYEPTGEGLSILRIPAETNVVRIPGSIGGVPVLRIGTNVFGRTNYSVTELIIPDGVRSISSNAFSRCESLRKVSFGNGLQTIGERAFERCARLERADLPDSVVSIGKGAFLSCGMGSVHIPASLKELPDNAFCLCSTLTNIEWGCRLEKIGSYAFFGCNSIGELIIPHTVTNIEKRAFDNCTSLTVLTLPIGLRCFDCTAVYGCNALKSLYCEGDRFAFSNLEYMPASAVRYAYSGNETWLSAFEYGQVQPFSKESYPVYFDMNDGVVDAEVLDVMAGTAIGAFPQPQNKDMTFLGWFTKRVGGVLWTEERTVECPVKLFARWGCPIRYEGVGTGETNNPSYYTPGEVLSFMAPTGRSGSTFVGWEPSGLDGTESGEIVVRANWRRNKYTIHFDPGKGSGTMSDLTCECGRTYTLPKNDFLRQYYRFYHWSSENGLLHVLDDGATFSNLSARDGDVVDLTAEWLVSWIPNPTISLEGEMFSQGDGHAFTGKTCTVSFECDLDNSLVFFSTNGIAPKASSATRYVSPVEIADTTTFIFFSNKHDAECISEIMTTTVYRVSSCRVRFDANGGGGSMPDMIVPCGCATNLPENAFVKSGYEFIGWARTKDGPIAYADGAELLCLADDAVDTVRLFAKWGIKWLYTIENGEVTIQNPESGGTAISSDIAGAIEIPQYIGGCPVRHIGPWAFYNCESITAVTIPRGVTSIGYSAFFRCSKLTSLLLPVDLASVGGFAFYDCTGLESLSIPESVTDIGYRAFGSCTGLGAGVVTIDGCVLGVNGACPADVIFPVNTRLIAGGAFVGRTNLLSVSIGANVKSIGNDAFANCCGLTNVVFEGNAPRVLGGAFSSVSRDCVALVKSGTTGWDVDSVGKWMNLTLTWRDPIPDIGENPTHEQIAVALKSSKDPGVLQHVTNAVGYVAFREWSGKVRPHGGGDAVGAAGVMAAPHAWVSYALGSETLLEAAPTDADLTVEAFELKSGEDGKFDFTVSVKDVEVGGAATTEEQKEQVKENLKQVFGIEGGTTLEEGGMSSANVEIEFGTPQDGKVKFTAVPKDTGAKTFFMKVKVK